MLSAQAYSFRQKSKLAISLSWIGGYTNVVALLSCKTLISHVTGTTTWFGEAVAGGDWGTAWYFAFILGAFTAGAAVSAIMTEGARRRGIRSKYILPLAVEAVLLTVFAIGLNFLIAQKLPSDGSGHPAAWWLIGAACMAMGMQNATITRISGNVVRTTHLTGVVTDLGIESIQYAYWWRDIALKAQRQAGKASAGFAAASDGAAIAAAVEHHGFVSFGVVAGTLLYLRWPHLVMIGPIGFLGVIIFMDWFKPIADAPELDLLKDSELKTFGIVQALRRNWGFIGWGLTWGTCTGIRRPSG